jgi:hypothetical protein
MHVHKCGHGSVAAVDADDQAPIPVADDHGSNAAGPIGAEIPAPLR